MKNRILITNKKIGQKVINLLTKKVVQHRKMCYNKSIENE